MIRYETEPDFIIPLSEEEFVKKMEAFRTYHSQEETNNRGLEYIEARHKLRGAAI
jgi:hypothetical protein